MHLFWVWTEDHDEDWFVIAPDPLDAEHFFENYEGYDEGEAMSEWVMEIPEHIKLPEEMEGEDMGWPSHEFLKACGARFLRDNTPRVVEIEGRKFSEGMLEYMLRQLEDDRLEAIGKGRPNQTEPDGKN